MERKSIGRGFFLHLGFTQSTRFFFRGLAFVLEPVCKMLSNQRELIYNLIVFFSWKTTEKER